MNITSQMKTIEELLSNSNEYHVTRFQREYAWENPDLQEFWDDLLSNIKIEDDRFEATDYFIGSFVVMNVTDSNVYNIVDGQQRLTTLSILISVIIESYKNEGLEQKAKEIYEKLIENQEGESKSFKLINENVEVFLNTSILYFDKTNSQPPETLEEKRLAHTYKFFSTNLKKKKRKFKDNYTLFLEALTEEILFLKTIFISVDDENEAYIIFEILNSKGHDLENIDLIKNLVFKILDKEHPVDSAKSKWKKIKETLAKRKQRLDIDTYFRTYWLAEHGYISKTKIYQSVREKIRSEEEANSLLNDLLSKTEIYQKICNPQKEDWTEMRDKVIFDCNKALAIFNVVSPRPVIFSLLSKYKNGRRIVKIKELEEFLRIIENFHFMFTAITSQRASGLDRIYTKFAKRIADSPSTENTRLILKDFKEVLERKLPTKEEFVEAFNKLNFTNEETKDKKLIQYIFKKWEANLSETDELTTHNVTIEHILSQSTGHSKVGMIGNLLFLDRKINEEVDRLDLSEKIELMKNSHLLLVKEFIEEYKEKETWSEEDIMLRTKVMAEKAYDNIWSLG
ncbi:hypothetical protein BHE17_14415 [Planococcus maritimus]|uniref:DUF262 domain-containing protein n=1 Tax=Planococcus maritimus TaxID=192421 RepID=UPI00084CBE4D|nr:DUF262 domain-containing protein [Planococcus maritimus]OED33582.1 hypothetical protein BHE17_14415 [Planococcus maritimus]